MKILSSSSRSTIVSVGMATTVFGYHLVDQLVHIRARLQLIVKDKCEPGHLSDFDSL